MKWRIGRFTNTTAPGYDPKAPKFYEINATWESHDLTMMLFGSKAGSDERAGA